MKLVNMDIPGWNTQDFLEDISSYASAVPENGCIIELGAFFGRTTYTLGMSKKPSVKLITIDFWTTVYFDEVVMFHDNFCSAESSANIEKYIKDNPRRLEGEDFFKLWSEFTYDVTNKIGIRSRTDLDNSNFPQADFIFHDASHSYEDVYSDLHNWFPKLKKNGIFIIDDYNDNFPGLKTAVDQYVRENNLLTRHVGENLLIEKHE